MVLNIKKKKKKNRRVLQKKEQEGVRNRRDINSTKFYLLVQRKLHCEIFSFRRFLLLREAVATDSSPPSNGRLREMSAMVSLLMH